MKTISVSASKTYDVVIGSGLLDRLGDYAAAVVRPEKAMILTDDTVNGLYGDRAAASLEAAGFTVSRFVFPHGEASKTLTVLSQALDALTAQRISRTDLVVALGGGVVGDLAGFAAAIYLRGVPYIQVPTTLLAAVDSSVGGKTAVDLPGGKNLAGAFYQPALVLCDYDTLSTLPERIFREGCAEVLKYGVLLGGEFLRSLEQTPIRQQLEDVICACVACKRDIVSGDEFDRGQRHLLNLGHTIGHAVEAASGYRLYHGECVSIGMAAVIRAAARLGHCSEAFCSRVLSLLGSYGLPTETALPTDTLFALCSSDKKITGSTLRLVVPQEAGRCAIVPIALEDLREWIEKGVAPWM